MGEKTRTPVLYLAPWVDYGGTDKGTIDWFRWLDRDRFAPSLITTQPSLNRRLAEVIPYAEEVWPATEFFAGEDLPKVIFDFLHSREVEVLHIMNSRLAYDLLPDLAALPRPPAVVVQLHVEEQDKSGYVRYVTTRYGNLVDAFSLTSQHLAAAVERYEIPRSKCHVIYTGVDAEEEFSPERVQPIEGLEPGVVHILYPGRLVEQKDPLLMVDVATALRQRGLDFRIHVVGEGALEAEVRSRVSERNLDGVVRFHPATQEIDRWFAGCDLLLMTSVFEGVPYVVYEAMAMEVPIVAPALPGNAELMDDECGTLVSPRGHVDGYVDALAPLISDEELRRRSGEHARERVRERFSLKRMGDEHSRLYEELIGARSTAAPSNGSNGRPHGARPQPLRMRSRPAYGTPRVSLIVPCFNHGRYLTACLDAIREQTYPELEVIVVDDASTDPQTLSLIDELDRHADDVSVIRMPRNSGPSAARNAAIEQSTGRYLLPVDADNVLLPDAVSRLVEQLQSSGEHVGFIYPNLQYFGNRNDYFEAPDYNLHLLLQSNYADTSSLLDREIFDAGVRYPEEIVLGHEDWDFALSLAEHEVYGEPALAKTLLYRKTGFTRSDLVEYGSAQFHETVVRRHPSLFKREVDVKAHWSPALSVLPLEPLTREDERERLMKLSAFQSLKDFEVLARVAEPWPHHVAAPAMRRLPPELAASVAGALEVGLQTARGSHVLVTAGNGLDLLEDPSFVAKLMSTLHYNLGLGGVALTDAGSDGRFPLRLLRPKEGVDARPHALLWRAYRDDAVASPLSVREGDELGSLTAAIAARMPVQWRHAPGPRGMASGGIGRIRDVRRRTTQRGSETCERERRFRTPPALPGVEGGALRRWTLSPTWMPPETELICRHVSADGTRRVTTNDRVSPPGYILEYDIGMVRKFSAPGTLRLVRLDDGGYDAIDPDQDVEESRSIGFVEQAAFPLLDPLVLGVHRKTGTQALVSGPEDPLIHDVEPIRTLGFIESYPVNPRHRPHVELPFRVRGVVRGVDRERRRHVYAVGGLPDGEVVGEIGALDTEPSAGSTPVWLTPSGYLITDTYQPDTPRFQAAAVARWLAAPLTWGGRVAPTAARVRSSAKRALDLPSAAVDRRGERGADRQVEPVGYLASEPALHRLPLYSAVHPVTGDQLLTPWRLEADDMGYVQTTLLGYARGLAPVTGNAPFNRVTVPWASRFGQNARTS